MVCVQCGFNQTDGDHCQQCGTELPAPARPAAGERRPAPAGARPTAPARKDKHRPRALHDIDLTISGLGVSQVQPDPPAAAPTSKAAAPAEAVPAGASAPAAPAAAFATILAGTDAPAGQEMVRTTADSIDGRQIKTHLGVVVASGLLRSDSLEEFALHVPDLRVTHGSGLDDRLRRLHAQVLDQLEDEGRLLGANALIGIRPQTTFGPKGLWLFYSATAVRLVKP